MSPKEVAWRMRSGLRDTIDRPLVNRRRRVRPLSSLLAAGRPQRGFTVSDVQPGEWALPSAGPEEVRWLQRLRRRAERIAAGRLTYFDLVDVDCGDPIDWNRDHGSGRVAPMRFSPWLDYRDARQVGDCKYVWEPNRHQHLVVLARAYRAGGDPRYARAVVRQWTSWLAQCPYGAGMNWRSSLELAIRLINWVWAMDLIHPAGLMDVTLQRRLLDSVDRHLWQITRNYSAGSSANNHIIGEAAGVFIATSYFTSLRRADAWRRQSYDLLCRQIQEQTFPDGVHREQAIGYHLFVTEFLLLAGLVGRWTRCDFPGTCWSTLERMFHFVAALQEGGDRLPMLGDADDGYVLDLGAAGADRRGWSFAAADLFGHDSGTAVRPEHGEVARWLSRRAGADHLPAGATRAAPSALVSCHAFAQAGLYLLQSGHRGGADRISLTFDCGPLGLGSIAAHGHADALSITLRAFGVDVLVDPGTYDYFTHPTWRRYFRSSGAHNTLVVDGQDQSVMEGLFLWGQRAHARCLSWQPRLGGGAVSGEHDGYLRLADPTVHRRRVELDGPARQVTITDEVQATARHHLQTCFHLAEQCTIKSLGGSAFEIDTGAGYVVLALDPQLSVRIYRGHEDPIAGWVSRAYHHKAPAVTLTAGCTRTGAVRLQHKIIIGAPQSNIPDPATSNLTM